MLLSQESNGNAIIYWMNLNLLWRCCLFLSFLVDSLTFSQLICCFFETTKQR